jgi:hypothetical protein
MGSGFFNANGFDFQDPLSIDAACPPPGSVPEPMTLALLGTALLGFRAIRRRMA